MEYGCNMDKKRNGTAVTFLCIKLKNSASALVINTLSIFRVTLFM